ncbi:UNVERIFIED_CONTAM: hypothetical protein K2H54_005110 [Gekko kuhli]
MLTRNLACPASSIDSQEAGVSGAFPSKHRRCIVVHLPTCLPEEDPGTRDASVQVGVTCEDKATQWEENVQADPSLDKSLGAYSTANSCPPGPTSSLQAVNNLLREFCQLGLLLSLWDMGGHGARMADSESPREGHLCSHALREDPHTDFPGTGLHGPDATKPPPTFQEDPTLPWLA